MLDVPKLGEHMCSSEKTLEEQADPGEAHPQVCLCEVSRKGPSAGTGKLLTGRQGLGWECGLAVGVRQELGWPDELAASPGTPRLECFQRASFRARNVHLSKATGDVVWLHSGEMPSLRTEASSRDGSLRPGVTCGCPAGPTQVISSAAFMSQSCQPGGCLETSSSRPGGGGRTSYRKDNAGKGEARPLEPPSGDGMLASWGGFSPYSSMSSIHTLDSG